MEMLERCAAFEAAVDEELAVYMDQFVAERDIEDLRCVVKLCQGREHVRVLACERKKALAEMLGMQGTVVG